MCHTPDPGRCSTLSCCWKRPGVDLLFYVLPAENSVGGLGYNVRIQESGELFSWRILDKLTKSADSFYQELKARKDEVRAKPNRFKKLASSKRRKLAP